MFKTSFHAICAAGIALASIPASAAETEVAVTISGLDLTKPKGRETLERRLDLAVREACGTRPSPRSIKQVRAHRECLTMAHHSYRTQVRVALNNANAKRVAVLAEKLGMRALF